MSPLAPLDSPATTGELLRTLMPGEPFDQRLVERMPAAEWRNLVPAATYHRMAAATHVALRDSEGVPATVRDRLAAFHAHAFNRHLLTTAVLARVSRTLDAAGIPYVVIKGPVLAELVYPRPDVREYGDLDVLVAPEAFADALSVLEGDGARLIEQNWDLMLETGKGEVNLVTPEGLVIDLHWSTIYDSALRRSFLTDDAALVGRGVRVDVGGVSVSVPDPEDQLLHLCVHACLAGAHRMGWLQDIRLASTTRWIRWPIFWTRAEDQGLDLVASVALHRSRRCFRYTLPEPGGDPLWVGMMQRLDRVRPPWRWDGGQASARFVVGATRRDPLSSMKAIGSGVAVSARQLRDPRHPWRVVLAERLGRPPQEGLPNEFAQTLGGADEHDEYLRMVADTARLAGST